MLHIALEARPRPTTMTKGEQKRLRRLGRIPAAIYGKGMEAVLVTVEARDLARVLSSEAGTNTLVDLTLDGERHLVKMTDVDMDPIARTFRHVGLHKLVGNEMSKATVPIEIVGVPAEVATGDAVLETSMATVDVKGLPENLTSSFILDVSEMKIGDVKHISDVPLPEGFELLSAGDIAVVLVRAAMAAQPEDEAPAAAAEAEPAAA